MFNHDDHEDDHVGCVETGVHCIYDFEVYKINGKLWFLDHDDPEELSSYEEIKEFFNERGDDLDAQLKQHNII